jgi:hypothetical protein
LLLVLVLLFNSGLLVHLDSSKCRFVRCIGFWLLLLIGCFRSSLSCLGSFDRSIHLFFFWLQQVTVVVVVVVIVVASVYLVLTLSACFLPVDRCSYGCSSISCNPKAKAQAKALDLRAQAQLGRRLQEAAQRVPEAQAKKSRPIRNPKGRNVRTQARARKKKKKKDPRKGPSLTLRHSRLANKASPRRRAVKSRTRKGL